MDDAPNAVAEREEFPRRGLLARVANHPEANHLAEQEDNGLTGLEPLTAVTVRGLAH